VETASAKDNIVNSCLPLSWFMRTLDYLHRSIV